MALNFLPQPNKLYKDVVLSTHPPQRDSHTLAKTACISFVLKHITGTCNSFYYRECYLRPEKTLIIEPMATIKGIEIELEAKVITLWLVNCHPLRLSYKLPPQELETCQPTPRTVSTHVQKEACQPIQTLFYNRSA